MSAVHVDLTVKFRIAGIDLGTVALHKTYPLPLPIAVPGWPNGHVVENFNQHGVTFVLTLVTV